ncbi:MAG TPA: hypothetical protein VF407_05910 [Polyangiaceae bacterium]
MLLVLACASEAGAADRVRRRFDPDDLELDGEGTVHADVAFGILRGEDTGRYLVPDFDIDLGIAPNVELGLDGAWAVEGKASSLWAFDHRAPDPLWINSKIELYDTKDDDAKTAFAFGVQLGPRAAIAREDHGTGFQGVVLVGGKYRSAHTVLSGGSLIDCGSSVGLDGRPTAFLAGLDFGIDLDAKGTWSLAADLGGVFFLSSDKSQLVTTAGPVLAVTDWLDVSVNGLYGFLPGGDQLGGFLQLSPKIRIFGSSR